MFKNTPKFVYALLLFGLALSFDLQSQDCDKVGLVGDGAKVGLSDCPLVILSVNDGTVFIPTNRQSELSEGDLILFSYEVSLDSFACSTKFTSIKINCLDGLSSAANCAANFIVYPEDVLFTRTYSYDLLVTNADYQYEWSFGDGTTSSESNPTHTYQHDGEFLVCLSVANESCQDISCDTLTVNSPMFHDCDFDIAAKNADNTYQLEVYNTTDLGAYYPQRVSWYNYESGIILGDDPILSYTLIDASLFVNVCADIEVVYENESTCTATLCKTLFNQNFFGDNSASSCTALFTYLPSSNLGVIDFHNHSLEGSLSVNWDFGDGTTSNSQAPVLGHTYESPGLYEVCLSIQDSFACTNTLCLPVFSIGGEAICEYETDCVFPGDTDRDGKVNIFDALAIGLGYNQQGRTRPNASIEPFFQAALNWVSFIFGNLDSKHADCDGNGLINSDDYEAIDRNYQLIEQNESLSQSNNLPPVTLTFHADTLTMENIGGNEVTIPATLAIGSEAFPLDDIYGVAISFDYESDNIQRIETEVLSTSFLGEDTTIFKREKLLTAEQQYGLVLTKMDQQGVGGEGPVAELGFVIIGDLGDGRSEINLTIKGIKVIDSQGEEIPVSIPADSSHVTIFSIESRTVSTQEEALQKQVTLSPNPAKNLLYLDIDAALTVKDGRVVIYNTLGEQVAQQIITKTQLQMDISELSAGVYWVNVRVEEGVVSKQIVVVE